MWPPPDPSTWYAWIARPGDRLDRVRELARLVQAVGVQAHLDVVHVGGTEHLVDHLRVGAPVLVDLQPDRAGLDRRLELSRHAGSRRRLEPDVHGKVFERFEGPEHPPRRFLETGRDQRRDAGGERDGDESRGEQMHVGVDGARRRDQPVTRDRPGVRADREVHAVGDVGVAGPPDPGDPSVLDPDVRLHDAEQWIQHDRARDDRVELALARRAVVLGHPGAPVLRVAPERLVGRIGEVAFDPDPEVGVAQPDPVAGGRAVARRVLGARVPLRHASRPRPSVPDEIDLVRLAGRPSQRIARRKVEPEPLRRRPVELETLVRSPEREVRRHPDRMLAAVRHGEVDPLPPGASSTSPSPKRIAPGPSGPAGPNGSRSTNSRVPSSRRTSTRISGTIAATPSST